MNDTNRQLTHMDFAILAKHYNEQAGMAMQRSDWKRAADLAKHAQELAQQAMETYRTS